MNTLVFLKVEVAISFPDAVTVAIETFRPLAKSNPKYWVGRADLGKPDWDNFGKVVDAGNLVIWVDDGQIVDGRVRKSYGEKPGMWITVEPVATGVFG